jgi:hypothetical protein
VHGVTAGDDIIDQEQLGGGRLGEGFGAEFVANILKPKGHFLVAVSALAALEEGVLAPAPVQVQWR